MRNGAVIVLLVLVIALASALTYAAVGPSSTKTVSTTSTVSTTLTETVGSTVSLTRTETVSQTLTTTTVTTLNQTITETSIWVQPEPPNPSVLVLSVYAFHLPGGPVYNVTFRNNGTEPVVNLRCVFQNKTFIFSNINQTHPFLPGETQSEYPYVGAIGIISAESYPILVYGTYGDGVPFAFYETVKITD